MQEGIGRSGYRVIAVVFFGLGLLGLFTALASLQPQTLFESLGLALAGLAVAALFVLCLVVLARRPAAPSQAAETLAPLIPAMPQADPSADLGVEYDDVAAGGDELVLDTTPPEQPRAPIVVPPRKPQPDSKGWPTRKEPSGMTRGEALKRKREQPEFEPVREPPLVMARTAASAEATGIPDNVSLGKCGNCQVLLLAPKKRPIRLQCPRCERVHTMT